MTETVDSVAEDARHCISDGQETSTVLDDPPEASAKSGVESRPMTIQAISADLFAMCATGLALIQASKFLMRACPPVIGMSFAMLHACISTLQAAGLSKIGVWMKVGAITEAATPDKEAPGSLQEQFRLPRGILGRLVGWLMARDNSRLNRIAVELLDIGPNDSVLEIGFGPGQAIELLVQRMAASFIAGVDPSNVMVEQARARNQQAIEAGRVVLLPGSVEELPFRERRFSKVFAVNNFHTWHSRQQGLAEIRRVLRKDGLLLVCLRRAPARPGLLTKPGVTAEEIAADMALLKAEGFSEVRVMERKVGQGVVCLLAR